MRSKWVGWRWIVAAFVLYAVTIAVYFVIPARAAFGETLIGSAIYNHDAVLNAGILEWGYRCLTTSGLHFFDWPAGFPLNNGLAGTENLSGWQLFYAPMRLAGATVAAAYSLTLLSSLMVAALGGAALSMRFGASRQGALIAGFAFAFNPFHIDHAIHIQTLAICWSPIAILGLDMALEEPAPRALGLLAFGFVMTFLCGMYFGVFLSMVIVLYVIIAIVAGRYRLKTRSLAGIAMSVVAALAVLSPMLIHYLRFASSFGPYLHSTAEVSLSSLPLDALLRTPVWLSSAGITSLPTSAPGKFVGGFPGIVTLALAVAAVVLPFSTPRSRRAVPVLLALAIVCLLFALGPSVEISPDVVSHWLTALPLPGKLWTAFSAIRWPMRIFMYSALCVSILAGIGLTSLQSRFSPRRSPAVAVLCLALLFAELRPESWFSRDSIRIADPMKMSDAYSFLASESDRGGVVELPSRMDSGLATPYATRYAYASAGHLRGVVAFHGSSFPPLLDSLRVAADSLPDAMAIRVLTSNGVTRLVIHRNLMTPASADRVEREFVAAGDSILFETSMSVVLSLHKR